MESESNLLWHSAVKMSQNRYIFFYILIGNFLFEIGKNFEKGILIAIGNMTQYPASKQAKKQELYLRNRSPPPVNCWVIIHCLEVSCKEDQITGAQREWFIFVQLTDKQWIITQQFTQWSWSISILTHNKRRKHIRSLQLLPTFRHCTEEFPPIIRLRRISLHVIVTSFKRKNDVTLSNAMKDVIFQWRQLSHTLAVNYCPIYHSLLLLALKAKCVRIDNKTIVDYWDRGYVITLGGHHIIFNDSTVESFIIMHTLNQFFWYILPLSCHYFCPKIAVYFLRLLHIFKCSSD